LTHEVHSQQHDAYFRQTHEKLSALIDTSTALEDDILHYSNRLDNCETHLKDARIERETLAEARKESKALRSRASGLDAALKRSQQSVEEQTARSREQIEQLRASFAASQGLMKEQLQSLSAQAAAAQQLFAADKRAWMGQACLESRQACSSKFCYDCLPSK
jgi:chromosome segregation ATPase